MTDRYSLGSTDAGDVRIELSAADSPENEIIIEQCSRRSEPETLSALVGATLNQLGVSGVHISVNDQTCWDWVITARIEAAAKRLIPDLIADAISPEVTDRRPSRNDRTRQLLLLLPGNRPGFWSIPDTRPDTVIFDLSISAPETQPDAARLLVRNALCAQAFTGMELAVRINPLPDGLRDLPSLIPQRPGLILLPKCESPAAVTETVNAINQIATRHGIMDPIWVVPVIETARGVLAAADIARISDQIGALMFDAPRFNAQMGSRLSPTGSECHVARSQVLLAARAAELQALDAGLDLTFDSPKRLANAAAALSLGYDGIGCDRGDQIARLRELFANPLVGATTAGE